jgi:hypothetical protein
MNRFACPDSHKPPVRLDRLDCRQISLANLPPRLDRPLTRIGGLGRRSIATGACRRQRRLPTQSSLPDFSKAVIQRAFRDGQRSLFTQIADLSQRRIMRFLPERYLISPKIIVNFRLIELNNAWSVRKLSLQFH